MNDSTKRPPHPPVPKKRESPSEGDASDPRQPIPPDPSKSTDIEIDEEETAPTPQRKPKGR